jgi:ubiquinone/menaquinone biosynthesis C-methylase UbiE
MQPNPETKKGAPELTPPYLRHLVRWIRPFPDFDLSFIQPLRRQAVQKLALNPGDRVLDLGCGPGGSFPYLVEAVTPSGLVVGVEISPEAVINAQRRIEKHHWTNVRIVTADAEDVQLEGKFDAALMLGAPDIYASPKALANLMPYLKPGARFAAFGAKLSEHPWAGATNRLFQSAFAKATFASTPKLDSQPWRPLQDHARSFNVEERFFGWMFLAWGEIN